MIKEAITALVEKKSLTENEAAAVMEEIMSGKATDAQLAAFLTALRIKGETAEEIAGMARVMRDKAVQVKVEGPLLDVVGTGGDGLNTFNISTAAAFVAAGAGIKVAKHGNRAASSLSGSADVLEKLGIKIDLNAEQVQRCVQEVGIGFMYAQVFHPAMKYAGGTRKEIGIRTVFNILGPLTNPAHAENQLTGVPSVELGHKMISALIRLGSKHAVVVHGENGMDELSTTCESFLWEAKNGQLSTNQQRIIPEEYGLRRASAAEIKGGTAEENARAVRMVLTGESGPKRDIVVLNAAAALMAGNRVENLHQGVLLAMETIDSGHALKKLDDFIEFSQSFRGASA
jgi:anthranilate phosphoribosyltransferase